MAKFSEASDEIKNLVNEVSNELGLVHMGIDFEPLCVNKAKEVCTVSRASAVVEYLSNRDDLVLVLCYEDAFDRVDEKTRYMWIRMAMEQVYYDTEKDKLFIGVPTISVPIAFYDKYKGAAVDSALLGQLTIQQIQDEEKEKKQREAEEKKAKKKKQNY